MHSDAGHAEAASLCDHAKQQHSHNHAEQKSKTTCDKCFTCYLSVTQAITPIDIIIDSYGVTAKFLPMINGNYQTVSVSLFHPPKPAFA